jgi:hypothetical protein
MTSLRDDAVGRSIQRRRACWPIRSASRLHWWWGMTATDTENAWQCLRCLWILGGREGDEIEEHAQACPFRATGGDPEPQDVEVANRDVG